MPLAAGESQGELSAATGAGRSVNAEYLGILTILEPEPQARPASLIRRPRSQNVTPYLNLQRAYKFGQIFVKSLAFSKPAMYNSQIEKRKGTKVQGETMIIR